MSTFRDANGGEWRVILDAFLIDEAKRETGVDLAELSASGWQAIATDAAAVGRVLAVVCGDQIREQKLTTRQFARAVRGPAIAAGRKALLDEGADFFPPSEWSELQSNLTRRQETRQQTDQLNLIGLDNATKILPLAEAFMRLDGLTQRMMLEAETTLQQNPPASTDSWTSPVSESVSGQESTPETSAIGSLVSAE